MTTVMSNNNYEEGRKFIWNTLNLFRGHFSMSEYDLFLYLLHSYKSGFLKYYSLNNGITIHDAIQHALFCDERNYPEYELKLFDNYSHSLQDKYKEEGFRAIYAQLIELNSDWFIDNWGKLFDDLIELFTANAGRYGEGIQMLELTKFIASICKYDGKGVLYNPFAGSASYGTEIAGNGEYFGQELNNSTWAIGIMRLLAHGKDAFNFRCQDSITEWGRYSYDKKDTNCLFDCIIATPPFGMKVQPNVYENNGYTKVEDFLISNSLRSLKHNGTAIVVMPQGITYWESQSKQLRKEYVLNDKLDTVILLPSGAFCYSNISAVILMFSNNKENPGYVRMINGSDFTITTDRKKKIDYERLHEAITSDISKYVIRVTTEEIIKNDFNLLPTTYFKVLEELPKGYIKYKLSDIAEEYNGKRCTSSDTTGKVVKINTLSDSPFNNTLDYESIPVESVSNQYRKITDEVLLISKVRALKPTLVCASDEKPIYINSNILALRVKSTVIDINCLILFLSQITDLQVGTFIPNISISYLRNLEIAMPGTLAAQESYYLSAKQSYKMAQVKEFGLEELIASQKQDFIKVLRRRKHDINTYVSDIRNRIQGLNKFLIREDIDKMVYSTLQNTTVGDNLNAIISRLNLMGQYIEHIADENNYGIPQKVDLCSKLSEIKDGLNYKVELLIDKATLALTEPEDNDECHAYVNISPLDLDHVILNIMANASKHGFVDPDANNYIMQIFLVYEQSNDMYLIAFRNNGKPFPEGMTNERYGTPGEKAGPTQGNGEGGAIVKDTIEHYGGKFSILNLPEDLFPVTIIFTLPRYEGD